MPNSNFDYTSRDYSTIRSELLTRAGASLPEWVDRDPSDPLVMLVELWAYAADVLHYYVDRAATESFLSTATQRESVLALANLYDYTPNYLTSSTAQVVVYNGAATNYSVPAGTVFTGTANTTNFSFYSTSDVTVTAGSTAYVTLREGTRYTDQAVSSSTGSAVSNGRGSQVFSLYHSNIEPGTITVDVYEGAGQTAIRWRRVPRLVTSSASDNVYSVYVNANGVTQLLFGNGVNGRIPPINVTIKVSYTVSSGSAGNIPANSITTLNSALYPGLRVNSSTPATGGSDVENIAALKSSLPRVFRTSGRAVTLSDFADLALGVVGVSKVATEYNGTSGNGGSVSVYAVTYQGDYSTASSVTSISVDQSVRENIYNELMPNAMLGISTISVPSTITVTPVYTSVDLYVKDNYVAAWVAQDVEAAITSFFDFSKVNFGQVLTIGDIYRTILTVDGVDYAVITDFNTTSLSGGLTANGKITINDYQLPRNGGISVTTFGGVTPPT